MRNSDCSACQKTLVDNWCFGSFVNARTEEVRLYKPYPLVVWNICVYCRANNGNETLLLRILRFHSWSTCYNMSSVRFKRSSRTWSWSWSYLCWDETLTAERGHYNQPRHTLYRSIDPHVFCSRHNFSTDGKGSRHQLAANFNSVRSVDVQLACHTRLGSPLLPPPSPSVLPPKAPWLIMREGMQVQLGLRGVSINALQINKE